MPALLEAVRAYGTVGEMSGVLKNNYGGFDDPV
jgi:hypothetical protein